MVGHYSFPVDYFDTEIIAKAVFRQTMFPGGINFRKNSTLKFCHFWPNCLYLPLIKISFLDSPQILIETLSIESVDLKTSSGTNCRGPNVPGTKKYPKEEKLGSASEHVVGHYSFPVDYFDTEIIPKAVFRQTMFPGGINFRKKSTLNFCCQSNQWISKPLGQILGVPRDQGKRNSQTKKSLA